MGGKRHVMSWMVIGMVLLGSILAAGPRGVHAQASVNSQFFMRQVGGETQYFDLVVEPGKSVAEDVELVVVGEATTALSYTTNLVVQDNGGYGPTPQPEELTTPAAWVDFPTETVELVPDQPLTRTFTVTVPEGTGPGEYTAALVLAQIAEEPEATPTPTDELTVQVKTSVRFVMYIAITVPGTLAPQVAVGNASVETTTSSSFVLVEVVNGGNTRLNPLAAITVTSEAGDVLISEQIQMGTILAFSTARVRSAFTATPALGNYTVSLELTDTKRGVSASAPALPLLVDEASLTVKNADAATQQTAITDLQLVESRDADGKLLFIETAVVIENPGQVITNASLTLTVLRDGVQVEEYPLATSVNVASGTTEIRQRYLPMAGWTPGTYAFSVKLEAVDAATGNRVLVSDYSTTQTVIVQ